MRAAAAHKPKAKNSLANLSRSCSTDRVLNLTMVHQDYRDTPEYKDHPLFRNPRLNKSIFLKHTLRMHEREMQTDKRMTVTKVILPFDTGELALGGFSCFLNEPDLEKVISSLFGGDINSEPFQRDMQVLRIMDSLPTFDPFLLRERLKRDGVTVSRCYFDLTEADANRMREYVRGEIQKIVRLALAGEENTMDQSSTMTHKLMTDETASSLEPLRQASSPGRGSSTTAGTSTRPPSSCPSCNANCSRRRSRAPPGSRHRRSTPSVAAFHAASHTFTV
jgi:hypothetical protein